MIMGLLAAGGWALAQTDAPVSTTTTDSTTLKVPREFKRKIVKGQTMYCTKTTLIGSRFPKTVCVDEAGLRTLLETRAAQQQDLKRAQSLCASGRACQIE